MTTQIFVNLPVKDLSKSIGFFTQLGFKFNPQFTDDKGTCMIIADNIFVMLLVEEFFQTFTKKKISDAKENTETILCISAESREKVNEMLSNALAAGANEPKEKQDHGWMFLRGFEDIDGHLWEVAWMDPKGPQ